MVCPNIKQTAAHFGTTDVGHVLDRLEVYGWDFAEIEARAERLLQAAGGGMRLNDRLVGRFGTFDAVNWGKGRHGNRVAMDLLCAVALGWLTCWHMPADEDVELELTDEGRRVLAEMCEKAAGSLSRARQEECSGCASCQGEVWE